MGDINEDIEVYLYDSNGNRSRFSEATSFSMSTSIDSIAYSFSLSFYADKGNPRSIMMATAGARIEVLTYGGEQVLAEGSIDAVSISLDSKGSSTGTVQCRSPSAILVDSCVVDIAPFTYASIKDVVNALSIDILFGLSIANFHSNSSVSTSGLECVVIAGETYFDVLKRCAQTLGLTLSASVKRETYYDVMAHNGSREIPSYGALIEEGGNLISAKMSLDMTSAKEAYKAFSESNESKKVFVANTKNAYFSVHTDTDARTVAELNAFIEWRVSKDIAKEQVLSCSVIGLSFREAVDIVGNKSIMIWRPRQLVSARIPSLGILDAFVIVGVSITVDDSGTVTRLSLEKQGARSLNPLSPIMKAGNF